MNDSGFVYVHDPHVTVTPLPTVGAMTTTHGALPRSAEWERDTYRLALRLIATLGASGPTAAEVARLVIAAVDADAAANGRAPHSSRKG